MKLIRKNYFFDWKSWFKPGRNTANKNTPKTSIISSNNNGEPLRYSDDYFKIAYEQRPKWEDYWRPSNQKPYSDKVKTNEGFKLRELLLLIWIGNTKNPRKVPLIFPKYFVNLYIINPKNVANKFTQRGYIKEFNGKVILTDKGTEVYQKYAKLWEIHQNTRNQANLDEDFPNWDKYQFVSKYHNALISYHRAMITNYERQINFLSSPGQTTDDIKEIKSLKILISQEMDIINLHFDELEKLEINKTLEEEESQTTTNFQPIENLVKILHQVIDKHS